MTGNVQMGVAVDRRLPVGAAPRAGGVHFRVWAPRRGRVEVALEDGRAHTLVRDANGYHEGLVSGLAAGARYRFRLDGGNPLPDPASRFQPEGPHGPSEVIDAGSFRWTDGRWPGVPRDRRVVYEMHIGTFSREGTWTAAAALLPALADVGVTLLEVMPVADFPGRFGWGYDGVNLFAPTRLYGRPDDFRAFVDRAHAVGLGVILDVVYNHLGPDGNYLREFSADYFTNRYTTPWGESLHFDGEGSGPVREYYLANAAHWMDEYHLDGLRLDATHTVNDASGEHILAAVARVVRERGGRRRTTVIAEDEPQRVSLLRSAAEGGWGVDAIWHDAFHHSAHVAATGRREGYFMRFSGTAPELAPLAARSVAEGAGGHAGLVNFLQNHDQVSVLPGARRFHQLISPGRWRAFTSLLLLGPNTPMLFQGDEFGATAPFPYFADHEPSLAGRVHQGRVAYLAQFASLADPAAQALIPDPADAGTFEQAQLDNSERARHLHAVRLHRDLLALRRSGAACPGGRAVAAPLAAEAMALRMESDGRARLLLVNWGGDLDLRPIGEPALAAPGPAGWDFRWSSDAVEYGGPGVPEGARSGALVPAESAVLLEAQIVADVLLEAQTVADRRSGPV
jgi:maltooligosyltrehalose trehalohydrolase